EAEPGPETEDARPGPFRQPSARRAEQQHRGPRAEHRPAQPARPRQVPLRPGGQPEHREPRAHHRHRRPLGALQPHPQEQRRHDRGHRKTGRESRAHRVDGHRPQGDDLQPEPQPVQGQSGDVAPLPQGPQEQHHVAARVRVRRRAGGDGLQHRRRAVTDRRTKGAHHAKDHKTTVEPERGKGPAAHAVARVSRLSAASRGADARPWTHAYKGDWPTWRKRDGDCGPARWYSAGWGFWRRRCPRADPTPTGAAWTATATTTCRATGSSPTRTASRPPAGPPGPPARTARTAAATPIGTTTPTSAAATPTTAPSAAARPSTGAASAAPAAGAAERPGGRRTRPWNAAPSHPAPAGSRPSRNRGSSTRSPCPPSTRPPATPGSPCPTTPGSPTGTRAP